MAVLSSEKLRLKSLLGNPRPLNDSSSLGPDVGDARSLGPVSSTTRRGVKNRNLCLWLPAASLPPSPAVIDAASAGGRRKTRSTAQPRASRGSEPPRVGGDTEEPGAASVSPASAPSGTDAPAGFLEELGQVGNLRIGWLGGGGGCERRRQGCPGCLVPSVSPPKEGAR